MERLQQYVQENSENCRKFVCVPTSFQARQLILDANSLPLGDLEQYPRVFCTIDGADEVDLNLNCIKGGGGCQTQEKIVAFYSEKLIIVADYRKQAGVLGEQWKKGVPIEVLPFAYKPVLLKLKEEFQAKALVRMSLTKAGPCITDNGNMIIDADFGLISDPVSLDRKLHAIPGIVETGLFVGMAHCAYFGNSDGYFNCIAFGFLPLM